MQGDGRDQVVMPGLAGTLLELRLDLSNRGIQALEQEIEERCQTAGLHLGDDLECGLAAIEFINNLHAGHMPLLQLGGRMHTLPCMATDLVTRIYRQLAGENMSPFGV